MKGLRCWWWMGCVVAGLFGGPSVHAASVRISFFGAVVEPTCTIRLDDIAGGPAVSRGACGGQAFEQGNARAFHRAVARVEPGASDRLLTYLKGYAGDVRLVTQTYD